jgi:hypothetical protein
MRCNVESTPLPPPQDLPIGVVSALALLSEARDSACRLDGYDPEFAVEMACLLAAGATPGALRWLLHHGYAEHLVETTTLSSTKRSFRTIQHLALGPRSCFVLTAQGAALLLSTVIPSSAHKPNWDRDRRELRFGPLVMKRFTQPASVQETILASFEEEGWPERIDDPLRPSPDQDAVCRLRSAVNNLNRGLHCPFFRFGICGLGTAIYWRVTGPTGAARNGGASDERVLEEVSGRVEMPRS